MIEIYIFVILNGNIDTSYVHLYLELHWNVFVCVLECIDRNVYHSNIELKKYHIVISVYLKKN